MLIWSWKNPYICRIFGCFIYDCSFIYDTNCYSISAYLNCFLFTIFNANRNFVDFYCAMYTFPNRPFPNFLPTVNDYIESSPLGLVLHLKLLFRHWIRLFDIIFPLWLLDIIAFSWVWTGFEFLVELEMGCIFNFSNFKFVSWGF